MKRFLFLAAIASAVSQLAVAAPCTSGTLASYISLGSAGCTIGGDTLNNFQTLTGSANHIIGNGSVNLSVTGGTYNPLLTITTNQTVADLDSYETIFTYDISGALFTGISATLSGAMETNANGGVTGLVDFCEGGSFGPDGVTGCLKPNGGLTTVDGAQNMDMSSFANASFLNVTNDFQVDGAASGGTLTNSFTAVPEPLTATLAGLGLMLLGGLKARSIRAKQESK